MRALMTLLISAALLGQVAAAQAAVCVVPEGPKQAELAWRGQPVLARPGALVIGARTLTPCDGLPGPQPQALLVGPTGDLWVGFQQAGLHRFDGARFTAVTGLPPGGVRALAVWDGAVWVGTGAAGLWRVVDGAAQPFAHRTLGERGITALAVGGDGLHVGVGPYGWWRVRSGGGVARLARGFVAGCFAVHRGRVRAEPPGPACDLGPAPAASGLPSAHVTALAEHGGALWVGLFDQGLARSADGVRFRPVPEAPRLINALLPVGDTLWIASAKGLFFHRDGRVRPAPVRLPSAHVNGLVAAPDGTLWVAHSVGVTAIGPAGVRHIGVDEGLPARIAYAVTVAHDGAVWVGTAGGAARLAGEGVQVFGQADGALPHDWINALAPYGPDGVLAGTYDAGVVALSPRGGEALPGLEGAWVNPGGLWVDGGVIWVATLGTGLWRAAQGAVMRLPALPADDVTATVWWRGQAWVGTRGGLAAGGA